MSESGYNGWSNYQTWAVKLWLDNEESSYENVRYALRRMMPVSAYALADWLSEYVADMMPELPASLASDLLSSALGAVDWHEIAEAYLSDYEPDESDSESEDNSDWFAPAYSDPSADDSTPDERQLVRSIEAYLSGL